jgi:hypothetical protein
MATVTIGAAQSGQPETAHVGVNAVVCKVSLSVSWSSGDVHRIGKIPNGAIPLGSVFYPGPASGTGFVAKFGTSASQELFFASASFSLAPAGLTSTRRLGYGMQISISDDAAVNYDYLTMVATAGASVGYVGDLVAYYKMPGQSA